MHLYKAFLFDLDGVLVDSYECWWHLLQETLIQQGKQPVSREAFDAAWGQGPEADQKMFFPDWTILEVLRYYDSNFSRYTKWAKPQPEAGDVLRTLSRRGHLVGIASNSTLKIIEALLKETSLYSCVDVCVGIDEVKKGKPSPDLILRAIEKLRVRPEDVCYVGDSIFDQKAARASGVFFVGYKRSGDLSIQRFEELLELSRCD